MATDYGFTIKHKGGYSNCFFQKIIVSGSTFGSSTADGISPDVIVNVNGCSNFSLSNETAGSVVEVSFNGNTLADELDSTQTTKFAQYINRPVGCIWLRLKSGSSATVAIRAW